MAKMKKNGRSKGDARHARFYHWELESPAFRSLSCPARCLLLEFKALYNGINNGRIGMGVRQAARLLNRSPGHMAPIFQELEGKGFIKLKTLGTRPNGQGAANAMQTEWSLTEFETSGQPATKDFMSWRPAENETPYS
jgi:hypothetical protein